MISDRSEIRRPRRPFLSCLCTFLPDTRSGWASEFIISSARIIFAPCNPLSCDVVRDILPTGLDRLFAFNSALAYVCTGARASRGIYALAAAVPASVCVCVCVCVYSRPALSLPSISSEIHLARVPLRFQACKLDETGLFLFSPALICTSAYLRQPGHGHGMLFDKLGDSCFPWSIRVTELTLQCVPQQICSIFHVRWRSVRWTFVFIVSFTLYNVESKRASTV